MVASLDPTAMKLDDAPGNREPEAGALRLARSKRLENRRSVAAGKSGPVIANTDRHHVRRILDRYLDASLVTRLNGVAHHVLDRYAKALGIDLACRDRRVGERINSRAALRFDRGGDPYRQRQVVTERLAEASGLLPQGVSPPQLSPLSSSMEYLVHFGFTHRSPRP